MEDECFKPSSTRGSAGSPSVTTDRVVRPFEWGLDWIPDNGITPRRAAGESDRASGCRT